MEIGRRWHILRLAARFHLERLERRILRDSDAGGDVPYPGPTFSIEGPSIIALPALTFDGTLIELKGELPADLWTQIDWGDGTFTQGTIRPEGDGAYALVASHTFASDPGPYGGVFTSLMSGGDMIGGKDQRLLLDAGEMTLLESVAGSDYINDDKVQLGSFYDQHPQDLRQYDVSVDWGDGTTSAGTLEDQSDGTIAIYGIHQYAVLSQDMLYELPYNVSVTVTRPGDHPGDPPVSVGGGGSLFAESPDSANNWDDHQGEIVPIDGDWSKVDTRSLTVDGELARFRVSVPSDSYDASILWGDGGDEFGAVSVNSDGTISVSGQHTFGRPGVYDVEISVDGSDGALSYGAATVYVGADDLLHDSGFDSRSAQSTTPTPQDLGSFVDRFPADPSAYQVSVDWGDGSPMDQGAAVTAVGDGVFTVQANHAYGNVGSYPVSVTVSRGGATTAWDGAIDVYAWDGPVLPPVSLTNDGASNATDPINAGGNGSLAGNEVPPASAATPSPAPPSSPPSSPPLGILPAAPTPLTASDVAGGIFEKDRVDVIDRDDPSVLS